MKKFIIEDEFWKLFPKSKIGIVVCNGIDNRVKESDKYLSMILDSEREAKKYITENEFSSNRVVKVWRDAFKQFSTKKGARSSIESLLKRVSKGNDIGTINPLVDIYNSASLRFALPCGGEDIDKFEGNIKLTRAAGGEYFMTLGSNEEEPPREGEIVYKDDAGIICRCWNWRESVRTMLTEETKNAFLCVELIDEERDMEFNKALEYLKNMVCENLGGKCRITILDNNFREINIE